MDEKVLSIHSEATFMGLSVKSVLKRLSIFSPECYFSILLISDLFLVVSTWLLKISYCPKNTMYLQINAIILPA
jgi:hypothetical protein